MENNLKEIFLAEQDEIAEKIGREIAAAMDLKKDERGLWVTPCGAWTDRGLARRFARFFLEVK